MNGEKAFLDSNVLVYLYSNNEINKRTASLGLFSKYICVTSTQGINELCNVIIKKYNAAYEESLKYVNEIEMSCIVGKIDVNIIKEALYINTRYRYSYYDSLMIASAKLYNCNILFSEDMNHGQVIDNRLTILNPYIHL